MIFLTNHYHPGNILFEARENSLCSYTVDTDDLTGVVSKTGAGSCFLQDLSFTVGIDADVRDRTLFFSDINEGTLRKVSIADGTQAVKQVFHALGQVEGKYACMGWYISRDGI